jgi:cytochrome P450
MTADHIAKGCPVTDFDTIDFFTDPSLVPDPHPYFDYLRAKGPVVRESLHGVVAVTGYDEAMALYKDIDSFSSCVAVGGPFPPLPFEPSGDDISDLIEQHRTELPLHERMVTMDPPDHTRARSVLSRLLTPARLKENQDFLLTLADEQLDEFVDRGECEFLAQYSKPYSLLAVANLLGVPETDHKEFRMELANSSTRSSASTSRTGAANPVAMC